MNEKINHTGSVNDKVGGAEKLPKFATGAPLLEPIAQKTVLSMKLLELAKADRPINEVLPILEQGADPDFAGEDKMTSLMFAGKNRNLQVGFALVEFGADKGLKSLELKDALAYLTEAMNNEAEDGLVPAKGEILKDFLISDAKSGEDYYQRVFNPAHWA